MPRTPLIVGNWKMHKTIKETKDFCLRLKNELAVIKNRPVEVAVAPPFTALAAAAEALLGSSIAVVGPRRILGRERGFHRRDFPLHAR